MSLVGSGILASGEADYFEVRLQGGVTYSIYVRPDNPNVDFDLFVYDENGNLVEQDTDADSDALCLVTPAWTGPFRLKVKSAGGISTYRIEVHG